MCYLYSAIIKRGAHLFCSFNDNMWGGVMDLVYGSLSSSYMTFCVFFSDECFYLYDYGFVYLLICYRSSCCSQRRHSLFQEDKYKTVVRHTLCISFCGFDCDIHTVAWSA